MSEPRRLRGSALGVISALVASIGLGASVDFKVYTNARFGFRVEYPADWGEPETSTNGDGARVYNSVRSASIVLSGWRLDGDTVKALFDADSRDDTKRQRTVTYKVMKGDWYVVSGFEGDNIFYRKVIVREAEDRQASFTLTFPKARKVEFDPVIARIAASLAFLSEGATAPTGVNTAATGEGTAASSATAANRKSLKAKVETRPLVGDIFIYVGNDDSFDWHNVTICVNDVWCLRVPTVRHCRNKSCTGPDGSPENPFVTRIWFMQHHSQGLTSDFRDGRGVSNREPSFVEVVSIKADEGDARWAH